MTEAILMKNRNYLSVGIIFLLCLVCLSLLIKYKQESISINPYISDKTANDDKGTTSLDTATVSDSNNNAYNAEHTPAASSSTRATGKLQRQNLIFNFTAEASNCLTLLAKNSLNSWNSLGTCCPYSITRSADHARTGNYSTRYELHSTDDDVANSKRAEAARATTDEPTLAERWYGISYYLPKDYVRDDCPELITQWQSLKGVSPPLALWTHNGNFEIVQFGTSHTDLGVYETDKWVDFVFHVKWSTESDGLLEVWKKGVKVFSIAGANSYSGYSTGNYLKNGIYKWGWKKGYASSSSVRVIYIDDVRIGNEFATYNDVAPGKD